VNQRTVIPQKNYVTVNLLKCMKSQSEASGRKGQDAGVNIKIAFYWLSHLAVSAGRLIAPAQFLLYNT